MPLQGRLRSDCIPDNRPMSISDIRVRFAKKLRSLRLGKRLTQAQVAELADMKLRHYQKLESKHPSNVKIETIAKLAKALKIPAWKLLQFKD
jgi:transcriptional regulator with XRE-family HTH domain